MYSLTASSFKFQVSSFNFHNGKNQKFFGKSGNYENHRMKRIFLFLFFRSFGYAELKVPFFPLFLLNPSNP